MRRLLLLLTGLALLAACDRAPVYSTYRSTPAEGWETIDTLTFPVDSIRRAGTYRLSIGVRTGAARPYPFQTLWMVVKQVWHTPRQLRIDTLSCRLVTPDGDRIGRGVSLYQYDFPLDTLTLPQGARGYITIRHIMRRTVLQGIVNVGVRLD